MSSKKQDQVNLSIGERIRRAVRKKKEYNEMDDKEELQIGVWGPQGAGKTTYVVMVWGTCLVSGAQWRARPNDPKTSRFVIKHLAALRKTGEFPPPTPPNDDPVYRSYYFAPRPQETEDGQDDIVEQVRSPFESFADWIYASDVTVPANTDSHTSLNVSFTDVAGERYKSDPIDSDLWNHIWKCKGLLCLLDPEQADSHFDVTLNLVQNLWLKSNSSSDNLVHDMLPHYVALCFSKIDRPGWYEYRDRPEALVDELEDRIGVNLLALLDGYFLPDRIKVFTLSSIGVDEQGQSLNPNQEGRVLAPNKIRPINLISPLRWLFESLQNNRG
jgi:hypothetical protein